MAEIEFDNNVLAVDKEPEQDPKYRGYYAGNTQTAIEELENAIRILEMSDDEFVNASTMKSISQYL